MSEIDNELYDLPEITGDDSGEFPETDKGLLNITEYDVSADIEGEPAAALEHADFSKAGEEALELSELDIPKDTEDEATEAAGEELGGKKPARGKKNARRKLIILLAAALAVLALFFVLVPGGGLKKIVNNTRLMHAARVLKTDIKELGKDIKAQETEKTVYSHRKMQQDIVDIRDILSNPFWSTAGALPPAKGRMDDVKALLDIVDEADAKIIGPLISLMAECPLSELKTDKGINDTAVLNYLRLIDSAIPEAKDLAVRMKPLELGKLDSSLKKIEENLDDFIALMELAEDADEAIIRPLLLLVEEYPISELKPQGIKLNDDAIVKYIRLFEDVLPESEELINRATIDLSRLLDKKAAAGVSEKLELARILIKIAEDADETIISQLLPVMEKYHISDLKTDDGLDVNIILKYLDFYEDTLPKINELAERIKTYDLSGFESSGSVIKYISEFEDIVELCNETTRYLPIVRGVIGDGSDRVLLLVAQNNAEIRSLGGFPGKVGTITIKNGKLKMNGLGSAWSRFPKYTPASAKLTRIERKVFYGIWIPRDAEICPVFERVALIWAEAYAKKNGVKIDGVVSATQMVIEKYLSFLGSIELSDGTIINGDNVMRYLCHDLYVKYFSAGSPYTTSEANRITDRLFNEIASKTVDLMLSGLKPSNLRNYYEAIIDGMNDRSIQIWVREEEVQQLIRDEGWNSRLNDDSEHPEIGIYFSATGGGSKNSWYLDIDVELSDATVNADGTRSYELKATFTNTLTEEEKAVLPKWIIGKQGGDIGCWVYVFAPAGGSISKYHTSGSFGVKNWKYMGLRCYVAQHRIKMDKPLVITCTITTAPGIETVPTIHLPRTLTEYRQHTENDTQ